MSHALQIALSAIAIGRVFADELAPLPHSSLSDAPGNLRGADLSKAVDLDAYQGYGYDQQNRGNDAYGGGDSKSSLLISFLVPIVVLICVCCCVVQLIRCFCGEICGGNMDPMRATRWARKWISKWAMVWVVAMAAADTRCIEGPLSRTGISKGGCTILAMLSM